MFGWPGGVLVSLFGLVNCSVRCQLIFVFLVFPWVFVLFFCVVFFGDLVSVIRIHKAGFPSM